MFRSSASRGGLTEGGRCWRPASTLGILLGLVAALGIIPPAVAQSNATKTNTTQPTAHGHIVVDNKTGYDVDVIYHDTEKDTYTPFQRIASGTSLSQDVAPGLTWFFRVNSDAYIGQYTTTAEPDQSLVLDEAALDGVGYPHQKVSKDVNTAGNAGSKVPPPLPDVLPEKPSKDITEAAPLPPPVEMPPDTAVETPLHNWYEGPDDAIALLTKDATMVDVSSDNRFSIIKSTPEHTAQTTALWSIEAIPGTSTSRIRNLHYLDRYLYIDQKAQDGWAPLLGADGKNLQTGLWRVKKGVYYAEIINDARPDLRLAVRNNQVVLSANNYDSVDPNLRDMQANQKGDAWALFDVKSFRALMSMKDSFVTMAKNVQELDRQVAEKQAEIDRKKKEAEDAAKRRREIAKNPELISGGNDQQQVAMRLGVGDVVDTTNGNKMISYTFDRQSASLQANLDTSAGEDSQIAELDLEPTVSAFVKDGKLYVRLTTSKQTRIAMRRGAKPSTESPTDGNFYIAEVKMNAYFSYGREVYWSPQTEMERTDAGRNKEKNASIQAAVNPEMLMGSFGESQGVSVNFSAMDYSFDSGRGLATTTFEGSQQYHWKACGLAATASTTTNCTYTAPPDMYDSESQTLREIKPIALDMPGLETDTIFAVDYPSKQGLPDRLMLNLDVSTQFHAAKIIKQTEENTKNKDWNDFAAGFTYVFRPDKWDFNKSLEDQHGLKETIYKTIGLTDDKHFKYFLFVQIEDLKPFMK